MRSIIKSMHLFFLLLIFLTGTTALAQVHNFTWQERIAPPGTQRTFADQLMVLTKLPLKEFQGGNRYAVFCMAPVLNPGPPVTWISNIFTTHTDETIPNPVFISGFPAHIEVIDGRNYALNGNVGFEDGLSVDGTLIVAVNIKIGDTLLTISYAFATNQQDATAVPGFAATSQAEWSNYIDNPGMRTAADKVIDWIRIIPLN